VEQHQPHNLVASAAVGTTLAIAPWLDVLDLVFRIVASLMSIIVAYFAIREIWRNRGKT